MGRKRTRMRGRAKSYWGIVQKEFHRDSGGRRLPGHDPIWDWKAYGGNSESLSGLSGSRASGRISGRRGVLREANHSPDVSGRPECADRHSCQKGVGKGYLQKDKGFLQRAGYTGVRRRRRSFRAGSVRGRSGRWVDPAGKRGIFSAKP